MRPGQLHFAELALTEQGHFTGFLLIGQHAELIASVRRAIKTKNLDWNRRASFLDWLAVLI